MPFHGMMPVCRRRQRPPLTRDAMPSTSKRTENVRVSDRAVKPTDTAPLSAATIQGFSTVPPTTIAGTLKASITAYRQMAPATTLPVAVR
jgi:hypothetical protein